MLSFVKIPSALEILTLLALTGWLLRYARSTFLLVSLVKSSLKSQAELALENLALRQQLAILKRERPHARLRRRDRLFWVSLSAIWQRWRELLIVAKPETVVRWHRKRFALYWT